MKIVPHGCDDASPNSSSMTPCFLHVLRIVCVFRFLFPLFFAGEFLTSKGTGSTEADSSADTHSLTLSGIHVAVFRFKHQPTQLSQEDE